MYNDNLVLRETVVALTNKLWKLKEVFESKGFSNLYFVEPM